MIASSPSTIAYSRSFRNRSTTNTGSVLPSASVAGTTSATLISNATGNRIVLVPKSWRKTKNSNTNAIKDSTLATIIILASLIILLHYIIILFIKNHHNKVVVEEVGPNHGSMNNNNRHNYFGTPFHSDSSSSSSSKSIPRYVTVVMPSVVNPKDRTLRLAAISDTWGPKANAIYVVHDLHPYTKFSNRDPSSTTTKHYPKLLRIPSNISESMGLQRLAYVFNQLLIQEEDFDYAFFVNDHTFVIPEHLCYFLSNRMEKTTTTTTTTISDKDQQQPPPPPPPPPPQNDYLYAGHAMRDSGEEFMFNSGAAGYVLSRSTVTQLMDIIWKQRHSCYFDIPQNKLHWYQGNPGLIVAKCLHEALGVDAIDTRDDTTSTSTTQYQQGYPKQRRHVFHAFGLVRMVTGKVDEWYKNKHRLLPFAGVIQDATTVDKVKQLLPFGTNCCSTYSVSFHYVNQEEARALYELREWIQIQKLHEDDILLQSKDTYTNRNPNLEDKVRQLWPSSEESLGFYSHKLPMETTKEWKQFLNVLWDISTLSSAQYGYCWS